MSEKIIAATVRDASQHFYEIMSEEEPTGTDRLLGPSVDILIENPRISTNTFICHDACDVLINAMALMAGRGTSLYLQEMLGRPIKPIKTESVLPPHIDAGLNDAGPFKIGYVTSVQGIAPQLDVHVFYSEAEAYDFLVEDFAAISLCQQHLASMRRMHVGRFRIHVARPELLLTSQVHGNWDAYGWSIGCDHLDLSILLNQNFLPDLRLLLDEKMPVGIKSTFLRRFVIPAISILHALRNDKIDEACALARQLPPNLDWTLAVNNLFRVKGN